MRSKEGGLEGRYTVDVQRQEAHEGGREVGSEVELSPEIMRDQALRAARDTYEEEKNKTENFENIALTLLLTAAGVTFAKIFNVDPEIITSGIQSLAFGAGALMMFRSQLADTRAKKLSKRFGLGQEKDNAS